MKDIRCKKIYIEERVARHRAKFAKSLNNYQNAQLYVILGKMYRVQPTIAGNFFNV